MLADLASVQRAISKSKRKDGEALRGALALAAEHLESGRPVRDMEDEAQAWLRPYNLLSQKPILYLANLGLGDQPHDNEHVGALRGYAAAAGAPVATVCAVLEDELGQMSDEAERREFMQELGLDAEAADGALAVVIREAYSLLDLQTFFTTGEQESRAWRLRVGGDAVAAASTIHTDIGENLVKAEICHYDTLIEVGGWEEAKKQGKLRVEARDYSVMDGDVCHFLHRG
eukprot:COSAG01_NODE_8677_length_2699_cov_33.142308_1_plen_230_part_00